MAVKRVIIFFILCGIFITGGVLATNYLIPESFTFMQGKEEELSFNIPLKVSLYNEEHIAVAGMEDKSVSENIEIDLSQNNIIIPKKEGTSKATVSVLGIPVKTVSVNIMPETKVIPSGKISGIVMKTEGVLVLGIGAVKDQEGTETKPSQGVLKSGDIIVSCNNVMVSEKEDLVNLINNSNGNPLNFSVKRNDTSMDLSITPQKNEQGEYKVGIWVRDSTQGLGTVTFVNPTNNTFGALGHGVYDVDTKVIMPMEEGVLTSATITSVKKGEAGAPGEVVGTLEKATILGDISANTENGILGGTNTEGSSYYQGELMEIALAQNVTEGTANIRSNVMGGEVKDYEILIETVTRTGNDKGMIIKVTDKELLKETGGIIQGMSGSPIIQNNKIVGAVTHVFVKDPTKGYGIFIEDMLSS
ncbi:MAG: SpoIVB peptidase [Anaerotignaceae bacterium]